MFMLACIILHRTHGHEVACEATYPRLQPPSLQDMANNFHVVNEDETVMDAMHSRVLWEYLQTISWCFGAHKMNSDW